MNRYAVLPARGGSKRIPRKNLRNFCGKPIIQWVLETLHETELFERVIVTTEDSEIREFVEQLGFEAPFVRPDYLSDDYATTAHVAQHAIDYLISDGALSEDHFLTIYPTAVMSTPKHIRDSEKLMQVGKCDFVFVGCKFSANIERAWRMDSNQMAYPISPDNQSKRSQDLPDSYFDAGQFYWSTSSSWQENAGGLLRRKIFELEYGEVVDINNESDWILAEKLFACR